ncbi:hypothetical protein Kpol_1004p9 [Vanderwaltozyma polyspora DSM 70294]|uniref:SPRY domain-containing protein n=1 Tax=Vanderwaltozyma polyspora (strain ATCC 22028 / DSM 70294 / BCRC 21397 / CBS 2163 / NBRC 10782 / NRRL Y-8283 / UCD 57-17) TaxID=436907 RepID=A7TJ68_VANPO|nr:uncharacterized protein Kpol_1004p9 [Vanderwaltozyma polyspora DSM 70294]EDO17637.1 hypothetical protein Kpol_1004p9 [Vanderwaltozyma polyspora DSM 70294]
MKVGIIPYQKDADFVYKDSTINESKPSLPILHETHGYIYDDRNLRFLKPEDIPLNKRNFIYRPCSANPLFTELGYACTEYPFDHPGMNMMDRSDGISLIEGSNNIICVKDSLGWRTSRCDVCIKEGSCYWEVEVMKGGLPSIDDDSNMTLQRKKELFNTTPHLRIGISRREATLESPVGFDSYGYSIRDISLESIHDGKISQVLSSTESLKKGDRMGFLLTLPSFEEQVKQAKEYTQRRIDALISHSNDKKSNDINGGNSNEESTYYKKKTKFVPSHNDFIKELLEDIDFNNVIRDKIPIRYKNQLFFESTDYIKTTKPEYYTLDKREREDYYTLKGSSLGVYLNGKYLGDAFKDIKPFLPPFSELQYNEKFYFGYWKNGEIIEDNEKDYNENTSSNTNNSNNRNNINNDNGNNNINTNTQKKGLILRNKYVNNNQLGYYPTISCFNGGTAKIITEKDECKYFDEISKAKQNESIKSLNSLYMEQIAEDIVWDIIDEIEEESNIINKK